MQAKQLQKQHNLQHTHAHAQACRMSEGETVSVCGPTVAAAAAAAARPSLPLSEPLIICSAACAPITPSSTLLQSLMTLRESALTHSPVAASGS